MRSRAIREQALMLHADGLPTQQISRRLAVSRASIRDWVDDPARALAPPPPAHCFVCSATPSIDPDRYVYLLGQYLGDGHLTVGPRVSRLRITCANDYPAIGAEVDHALGAVSGHRPGLVKRNGCGDRYAYWKHWPCVFPQHGPGRKHERPIVLASWQRDLVDAHPWPLVRGLIHSDGFRAINAVTVGGRQYRYPRYFFANESRDIVAIMGTALDRVGVAWRYNRPNSISVAQRHAVALMDEHVGPKR